MIRRVHLRRLLILVFAVLCIGTGVWYKFAPAPSKLTLDDLLDGDFVLDRKPPFIPSVRLKQFLGHRVCIAGQISFLADGRAVLTRPDETSVTPLRFIICQPPNPKPEPNIFLGNVCATLWIRPQYDSAGDLATVFYLEDCRFEASP
jgi:hypothetical protein